MLAAAGAVTLVVRRLSGAPYGAGPPVAVTASLTAAGVHAAASDVQPTHAPPVSLRWSMAIVAPRIEGLAPQTPESGR
ncbi:MAG TPA: hypothetical protein VKT30_19850 [Caulobacteraceae bacterium]|nr:hypothetical protein [Caulobacteraceae bacterium]